MVDVFLPKRQIYVVEVKTNSDGCMMGYNIVIIFTEYTSVFGDFFGDNPMDEMGYAIFRPPYFCENDNSYCASI